MQGVGCGEIYPGRKDEMDGPRSTDERDLNSKEWNQVEGEKWVDQGKMDRRSECRLQNSMYQEMVDDC